VLRQGRMSPAQTRAYESLYPRFGLAFTGSPLDFVQAFGRAAPVVLEIGFGMGETTARIAQHMPQNNFLGLEVHAPGVGALLKQVEDAGLANVRVMRHDAVEVVRDMLAPDTLAGIHIFFPDPWPKARHHKRRLVQAPFAALLASRLAAGGYLHCATDWEDYGQQMLEVLAAEPLLENTASGFAPKPDYRPLTKFETRGLKLGHGVWDVVFRRKG
jgi:tRNA (guanine-N7-)-methyltransferase